MRRLRFAPALLIVVVPLLVACGSNGYAPATPAPARRAAAPVLEATSTILPTAVPQPSAPALPTEAPTVRATSTQETAAAAPVAAPTRAPAPTPAPAGPTLVPTPERPPATTIQAFLNLADRSFEPHQVHGNAGDTVVVTLSGGSEQHTFTIDSLGVDVVIPAGQTKQVSFVVPNEGETPFYCRFHGSAASGMHGLLIFH